MEGVPDHNQFWIFGKRDDDLSRAKLAADVLKGLLYWDEDAKKWWVWNGSVERRSESGSAAAALVYAIPDAMAKENWDIQDVDTDATWTSMLDAWCSEKRLSAVLRILKGKMPMPADVEFDAKPWLLNLKNGTLNLKTMKMQEHNPADYLTQISPATYNDNTLDSAAVQELADLWWDMQMMYAGG